MTRHQLNSMAMTHVDPLQLRPNGEKYRSDYETLIRKMGSDVLGALECATTMHGIIEADDDSWHREWLAAGKMCMQRAEGASRRGQLDEARVNWRRASIQLWAAELYLSYEDTRQPSLVAKWRECSRGYLASLEHAGETAAIPVGDDASYEVYLARGAVATAPVVICVGDWNEAKDNHLPLIQPALNSGLSILLVEPPTHAASPRAGHDRFAAASFLMSCVDYIEARSDLAGRAVVVYGIGAGAVFASQAARMDPRIRAIVSHDEVGHNEVSHDDADVVQADALRRWFIGSDRDVRDDSSATAAPATRSGCGDIGAHVEDVFGRIAAELG